MNWRRLITCVGALLAAVAASNSGLGTGPQLANAIQAPRQAPPPQVCEGLSEARPATISPGAVWFVAETGQFGETVGGLGIAGRKCWRKFSQLSRTVVDQEPQILLRGQSIPLSVTAWGAYSPTFVDDETLGRRLTGWEGVPPSTALRPSSWMWQIFNFFDVEPAIRDLDGRLGSTTWGWNELFLIPPRFDMSGCHQNNSNFIRGRLVPTCTVRLERGPVYHTGTTAPIPWTLFMGWWNSSGSAVLPNLVPPVGSETKPTLERFHEYVDVPVWIEPSPWPRMDWNAREDDILTVDFDASTTLYNGTIDRFEWQFESEDETWFRTQDGAQVSETFPGVGNYPVKMTVYADGQVDSLTGTVRIGFDGGGLSVKVESFRDSFRVDPIGDQLGEHEEVTITVTNSGDEPSQNVALLPDLFSVPGDPTALPTVGFAGTEPTADFYELGTIPPDGAVTRRFFIRGLRPGEAAVTARVSAGAEASKRYSVAASCRVGPPGLTPCPYIPPIDYLTPFSNGGSGTPRFQFDRTPTAKVTRQGPTGLQSFNNGTWMDLPAPASDATLSIAPQTWTGASAAGATRSETVDPNSYGGNPGNRPLFQPGDKIIINPGGTTQERRTVSGLGSLIYDEPLEFAHELGEMVTFDPTEDVGIPFVVPVPAVVLGASALAIAGIRRRRRRRAEPARPAMSLSQ